MLKSMIARLCRRDDCISGQLARYTVAGGVAFIVDFTVLVVLTEQININYLISSIIGFTCGIIVNYLISIYWVFGTRSYNNPLSEFVVFSLIGVSGLILHTISMVVLTEKLGLVYIASKLISTAMIFFYNFFARRYLLFTADHTGNQGRA